MPKVVVVLVAVAVAFAVVRAFQCALPSECDRGAMSNHGQSSIVCQDPGCGHANRPRARFCSRCGSPLGDGQADALRCR